MIGDGLTPSVGCLGLWALFGCFDSSCFWSGGWELCLVRFFSMFVYRASFARYFIHNTFSQESAIKSYYKSPGFIGGPLH